MTTMDVTPDNTNKLAYLMGRIFHPYLICIPTVLILLGDLPFGEMVKWMLLVLSFVLIPIMLASAYMVVQHHRHIYQRSTRGPIYLVFFLSVLTCLALLILFNAPRILIACFVTLVIWAPIQLLINRYVTKISTHAGVVAACCTGLLLAGKLNHPLLVAFLVLIVVVTMWSRVETKNHSVPQVLLGFLVGASSVLIVFPLVLM
jgi:hypothetical protein